MEDEKEHGTEPAQSQTHLTRKRFLIASFVHLESGARAPGPKVTRQTNLTVVTGRQTQGVAETQAVAL